MEGIEEKIQDEFGKYWDIDYEAEKEQYKKTAIELIAKAITRNDLKEIKEIIQELEDEIGQI